MMMKKKMVDEKSFFHRAAPVRVGRGWIRIRVVAFPIVMMMMTMMMTTHTSQIFAFAYVNNYHGRMNTNINASTNENACRFQCKTRIRTMTRSGASAGAMMHMMHMSGDALHSISLSMQKNNGNEEDVHEHAHENKSLTTITETASPSPHIPIPKTTSTFTEEDLMSDTSMSRFSFLSKSSATLLAVATSTADAPSQKAHAASASASASKSTSTKATITLQETISGFVSGAAITTTKTFVKYPLDTATVRLQMPNTPYSITKNPLELFEGSYRGIALPLFFNIPGGALFFAVKDATKSILKENELTNALLPKWAITCIAVAAAQPPYWLVRNPSEVIKTRQQANIEGYVVTTDTTSTSTGTGTSSSSGNGEENGKLKVVSPIDAIRLAMDMDTNANANSNANAASTNTTTSSGGGGVKNLYKGYWENIFYAYPADVIKFVAYEALASKRGGKKNLPPLEGAIYGAMATAVAQFVTTPLDVVRNRIMADTGTSTITGTRTSTNLDNREDGVSENDHESSINSNSNTNQKNKDQRSLSYLESFIVLAKEEGIDGLFAGATPRVGKAILSGAIQFATYESVQQSFREYFSSRFR